MMDNNSIETLGELVISKTDPAFGRKLLEFGSCGYSAAAYTAARCDSLSLTDKDPDLQQKLGAEAEKCGAQLIPDSELGEDCYFGRFHLVYTLFGFRGLPHLVDEIMRLRRLILKGGKMLIADYEDESFDAECVKQLKRCGFTQINTETFVLDGKKAFLITAEK